MAISLQYLINILVALAPNDVLLIISWGLVHSAGIVQALTGIIIGESCLRFLGKMEQ